MRGSHVNSLAINQKFSVAVPFPCVVYLIAFTCEQHDMLEDICLCMHGSVHFVAIFVNLVSRTSSLAWRRGVVVRVFALNNLLLFNSLLER